MPSLRLARELVHQLDRAGERERLERALTTMPIFLVLYRGEDRDDVLQHWSGGDTAEMTAAYRTELARWERTQRVTGRKRAAARASIADLFERVGALHEAEQIQRQRVELFQQLGDRAGESRALVSIAALARMLGRMQEALQMARDAEATVRELGDPWSIAAAVGNRGAVHLNCGEYAEALECFVEEERIAREVGDHKSIANAVGKRGIVHRSRGEYDMALACYTEQEHLARQLGDRFSVAYAVGNRGGVHAGRGEYDKALACIREQEQIARQLGERSNIAVAVGNRGLIHANRGEYAEALACFHDADSEHRAINFRFGRTYWLEGTARMLLELVQTEGMMPEYLATYVPGADRRNWKDLALRTARDAAELCLSISRELSKPTTLMASQILLARITAAEGDGDAAMRRLMEMLEGAGDDDERAEVHYWLWTLGGTGSHREEALSLYHRLIEFTPKPLYQQRINQLAA